MKVNKTNSINNNPGDDEVIIDNGRPPQINQLPLAAMGGAIEKVGIILPLCNELLANINSTLCNCKDIIKLIKQPKG